MTLTHRLLVAVAAASTLALAACSTSPVLAPDGVVIEQHQSNVTPSAVPPVEVVPTAEPREVEFRSLLQSTVRDTKVVGPDDQVLYGWNNLIGPTVFQDEPAQAQLQGSVWYVNGVGPFTGFLTLSFPDGSTLGMQMNGTANKVGEQTSFAADLVVIGGTGRYVNAQGSGEWTGRRNGPIGSAVQFNGRLTLAT